jgi:hypothetical protein
MRPTYLILGLVALTTVISLVVAGDPERAERLSTMYRDAAFSGETRDAVILLAAIGLGGFIAYLTLTRR